MKIDITDSNLQSFLSIAQKFPNGVITVEKDSAYWEWDKEVQQIQQPQQNYVPRQNQKPRQKNSFLRMFDAMGDYF